jgi:hypothetical protein
MSSFEAQEPARVLAGPEHEEIREISQEDQGDQGVSKMGFLNSSLGVVPT